MARPSARPAGPGLWGPPFGLRRRNLEPGAQPCAAATPAGWPQADRALRASEGGAPSRDPAFPATQETPAAPWPPAIGALESPVLLGGHCPLPDGVGPGQVTKSLWTSVFPSFKWERRVRAVVLGRGEGWRSQHLPDQGQARSCRPAAGNSELSGKEACLFFRVLSVGFLSGTLGHGASHLGPHWVKSTSGLVSKVPLDSHELTTIGAPAPAPSARPPLSSGLRGAPPPSGVSGAPPGPAPLRGEACAPLPSWRGGPVRVPPPPSARSGGPTWCPVAVGGKTPEWGWKGKPGRPRLCPPMRSSPVPA